MYKHGQNSPSPLTCHPQQGNTWSLDSIDAPISFSDAPSKIPHWVQLGLTQVSRLFVADHVGPAPLPGNSLHHYVFFLHDRPIAFDGISHALSNGERGDWYQFLDSLSEKMELGIYRSSWVLLG